MTKYESKMCAKLEKMIKLEKNEEENDKFDKDLKKN